MLSDDSKQALRAILAGDTRPWPLVLGEDSSYLAELHFPHLELRDMHDLAAGARGLGFEATEAEKLALSESAAAEAYKIGVLLIKGGVGFMAALGAVNEGVKALHELPENLRKLRDKIRPYLRRAVELSPKLQMDAVYQWLNTKYGEEWSCDLRTVKAKTITTVTVFVVDEQVTGNRHLLAVEGDQVEELPLDWLPLTR